MRSLIKFEGTPGHNEAVICSEREEKKLNQSAKFSKEEKGMGVREDRGGDGVGLAGGGQQGPGSLTVVGRRGGDMDLHHVPLVLHTELNRPTNSIDQPANMLVEQLATRETGGPTKPGYVKKKKRTDLGRH
jgi:hypothetical protein